MQEACPFCEEHLNKGLATAAEWTEADFGGSASLLHAAKGSVRAMYDILIDKMVHYDKLPYLRARLGEPGVRGRILLQYREAPPCQHHRVTNLFLGSGRAASSHRRHGLRLRSLYGSKPAQGHH